METNVLLLQCEQGKLPFESICVMVVSFSFPLQNFTLLKLDMLL